MKEKNGKPNQLVIVDKALNLFEQVMKHEKTFTSNQKNNQLTSSCQSNFHSILFDCQSDFLN